MTTSSPITKFVSKFPDTEISIFSRMSALAQQHDAINLSQGFPNYPISPKLIALVEHYMRKGYNQYAPMQGVLPLREALAEKINMLYKLSVDVEKEITITAGATQALFTAIGTLIRPGDEVVIFEPAYDSYQPSVELFGGKVVPVTLKAPHFTINWKEVEQLISPRTKLIIINNPTNPSTKVWKKADFEALEKLVRNSSISILSDEVYEHMVYDKQPHISVLQFPALWLRSFVVASFGKLLHSTGWKLGYIVAPAYLTAEFRKIHQFNVFSANTPMQFAIADYIRDKDSYMSLYDFFQDKRDLFVEGLKASRFKSLACEGTYFLLMDYTSITDVPELDYATQLTVQYKIATVPVSAFYAARYDQQLLRICFAKDDETILRALDLLIKV